MLQQKFSACDPLIGEILGRTEETPLRARAGVPDDVQSVLNRDVFVRTQIGTEFEFDREKG